jgi:Fe-S-cluster-containing hydrogenase component 2
MIRKIVKIDQEKCNGCGLCAEACHEGAIEIINGKAQLVSDQYCDGLGACLPHCPVDAIQIVERESVAFDEEAVKERMSTASKAAAFPVYATGHVCPGSLTRSVERHTPAVPAAQPKVESQPRPASELGSWPVQLRLVNVQAPYLQQADLLIAADCTAYAYGNFHQEFIKNRVTLIGCPKLDDNQFYMEKLTEIFRLNDIQSVKVVRMEVPCCGGIVGAVRQAMLASGTIVPYEEITVTIDGQLVRR